MCHFLCVLLPRVLPWLEPWGAPGDLGGAWVKSVWWAATPAPQSIFLPCRSSIHVQLFLLKLSHLGEILSFRLYFEAKKNRCPFLIEVSNSGSGVTSVVSNF